VQDRLASEDVVRQILKARQDGGTICGPGGTGGAAGAGGATDAGPASGATCTPLNDIIVNAVIPRPTVSSDVFLVSAEGRVRDVRRTVDAVVDRSDPAALRLLSWRVR
jgi:hypothetical protein